MLSIDIDVPVSKEVDYGCDVSLNLPSSLPLALESTNGDIAIEDTEADVTLKTLNGEIKAKNHYGQLSGSTSNGDIDVDIVLPNQGDCMLKTSNGNIALSIPGATSAMITASTLNGVVEVDADLDVTATKKEKTELKGRIGAGAGAIELESANGNIAIEKR